MEIPILRQAEPPKRYLLNQNNQLTATLNKLEKTLKASRIGRRTMPSIESIISPSKEVNNGLQPTKIPRGTKA
jgi:hypothetical protein